MREDKHENCLQRRTYDCPACGRSTSYETAEFGRCQKCGFTPGASLSGAVSEGTLVMEPPETKYRSEGAKFRHAVRRIYPNYNFGFMKTA